MFPTVHSLCVNVDWQQFSINLRFKMFRLSSSSTLGLWLSLLRRNTKTTFWTIVHCPTVLLSWPCPLCTFITWPMSPSRIRTAAVILGKRCSEHLEYSNAALPFSCWIIQVSQDAPCLASALRSSTSTSTLLQELFKWVVMGCLRVSASVSPVTAYIMSTGRGLAGSYSRHPQSPDVHSASSPRTGLLLFLDLRCPD